MHTKKRGGPSPAPACFPLPSLTQDLTLFEESTLSLLS
jgi:hypothetical protein